MCLFLVNMSKFGIWRKVERNSVLVINNVLLVRCLFGMFGV